MCNYEATRLRTKVNRQPLTDAQLRKKLTRHFRLFLWPKFCLKLTLARTAKNVSATLPFFLRKRDEARSLVVYQELLEAKGVNPSMVSIGERRSRMPDSRIPYIMGVLVIQLD